MKKILSLLCVTIILSACGNGTVPVSDDTPNLESNQVAILVDMGVNESAPPNRPFVSVTFCVPGTTTCQTVDHVLLDSGSDGLRIPRSVLQNSNLYPQLMSPDNNLPLYTCANYAAGYDFGSLNIADVKLGNLTATNVPFQIIDDSDLQIGIPSGCSDSGGYFDFIDAGQNAIIGVRNWIYDSDSTFTCENESCIEIPPLPESMQMATPIIRIPGYASGATIQFPQVPSRGASFFIGVLTIGINTQTNNIIESDVDIFYTDNNSFFKTNYNTTEYPAAFDSGTPFIVFSESTLPLCSGEFEWFYCPASPLTLNPVFTSYDGSDAVNATYLIQNPALYYNNAVNHNTLLPYAAATCDGCESFADSIFLWGLPYFYGKTIYSIFPDTVVNGESGMAWGVKGI